MDKYYYYMERVFALGCFEQNNRANPKWKWTNVFNLEREYFYNSVIPRDNKGKNRKHKPRVEQESHAMTPSEWEKVERYAKGEDLE